MASLARPGGNVTGISAYTDDLVPKRLELLLDEVFDGHIAVLLYRLGQPDLVWRPERDRWSHELTNAATGALTIWRASRSTVTAWQSTGPCCPSMFDEQRMRGCG